MKLCGVVLKRLSDGAFHCFYEMLEEVIWAKHFIESQWELNTPDDYALLKAIHNSGS